MSHRSPARAGGLMSRCGGSFASPIPPMSCGQVRALGRPAERYLLPCSTGKLALWTQVVPTSRVLFPLLIKGMCLTAGTAAPALCTHFFENVSKIVYKRLFLHLLSFAEEADAESRTWCSLANGLRCAVSVCWKTC